MPSTKDSLTASLVRRLVASSRKDSSSDIPWYEDVGLIESEVMAMKDEYTPNTFRKYKSLISSYCRELGFDVLANQVSKVGRKKPGRKKKENVYGELGTEGTPTLKRSPYRDVVLLDREDYAALLRMLLSERAGRSRYKWGRLAVQWLQCSVSTGLRPSEWFEARLLSGGLPANDGQTYMVVLECNTAKKGAWKERGEAITRRLILDGCKDRQIQMIKSFLSEMDSHYGDIDSFTRLRENVRQTLLKACKQAFDEPGRYSLYTGRHTFIQEVRRESSSADGRDYSRFELAAMIGHSDTVNQKYYGDRREKSNERWFSDLFDLPRPWPGSAGHIEAVERERYKLVYADKGSEFGLEASREGAF